MFNIFIYVQTYLILHLLHFVPFTAFTQIIIRLLIFMYLWLMKNYQEVVYYNFQHLFFSKLITHRRRLPFKYLEGDLCVSCSISSSAVLCFLSDDLSTNAIMIYDKRSSSRKENALSLVPSVALGACNISPCVNHPMFSPLSLSISRTSHPITLAAKFRKAF